MLELVDRPQVTTRTVWLVGSACVVTVVTVLLGMQAMWECVELLDDATGTKRDPFWYLEGIPLALLAAVVVAWLPPFRVARLLRVAVLLPLLHVGIIVAAEALWPFVDNNALARLGLLGWAPEFLTSIAIALPPLELVAIVLAGVVIVAIAIKHRHGEWAHATVMLALSFLLLLGLWLPIVARFAVASVPRSHGWPYMMRVLDADTVARAAIIPTATLAVLFVVFAFRCPGLYERWRHLIRPVVVAGLVFALLFAASLPDKSWLVYLESSYLVMIAVVVAVASLVLLATVTWLRSLLAHRMAGGTSRISGVVADDDERVVAQYEVTSMLRGPLLVSRPFVVTTQHGDVPISGARLLVPIPPRSTLLEIGDQEPVLATGYRVELAVRQASRDGHPFRASDAADVVSVRAVGARPYRFSDVVLVVWRPAVAYLAIVLAVAAPYLTIFLTD